MPVYSVVMPATSSLSASGMSKGMRFASASIASMKMTKAGMPRGRRARSPASGASHWNVDDAR